MPAPPDDPEPSAPSGPPVVGTGPCKISVAATPAGSLVQLDGRAVGPSPIEIHTSCERHRVDLSHPRYATLTRFVTPTAAAAQSLELSLSRPTHAVTVVTVPAGAKISIGGRPAGTSPTVVQVMGFYNTNLTIEKKGWKTTTRRVYSKSTPDRITVWLTRAGR